MHNPPVHTSASGAPREENYGRRLTRSDSNPSSSHPSLTSMRSIAAWRWKADIASSNCSTVAPAGFHGALTRSSYAESSLFNPSSQTTASSSRGNIQRKIRPSGALEVAQAPRVAQIAIGGIGFRKLGTTSVSDGFSGNAGDPA